MYVEPISNRRNLIAALFVFASMSVIEAAPAASCDYPDLVANMRWCLDSRNSPNGRQELIQALRSPRGTDFQTNEDGLLSRGDYIKKHYLACQAHQAPTTIIINRLPIAQYSERQPFRTGVNCPGSQHENAIEEAQNGCPPCLN